ncbi:hypothetical protein [Pseudidiomarina aestuarii]|uniref:hypothetical protein n=1 Tax=Pseudidiomarina aestuarii TaxID=624146 RepID=UPI003A9836EA
MKWPETWKGNLLAVIAIAAFGGLGAMMFRDVEGNLVGAVQGLASLMLAIVAVYALFNWRHQEVSKFKALQAANLFSRLEDLKFRLMELEKENSPNAIVKSLQERTEGKSPVELELIMIVDRLSYKLQSTLKRIEPLFSTARTIGEEFYNEVRGLHTFVEDNIRLIKLLKLRVRQIHISSAPDNLDSKVEDYIKNWDNIKKLEFVWMHTWDKADRASKLCTKFIDLR